MGGLLVHYVVMVLKLPVAEKWQLVRLESWKYLDLAHQYDVTNCVAKYLGQSGIDGARYRVARMSVANLYLEVAPP